MKKNMLFFLFIFLVGCKEQERENTVIQSNPSLQLYNDVLIELVEKHFYLRYLGEEGKNILYYSNQRENSTKIENKRIHSHNKIYGDSAKFKTVFLIDTSINISLNFNYYINRSNKDALLMTKDFQTNTANILDSLNSLQTDIKAKNLKSSTFIISSISKYTIKSLDKNIGLVSFSKVFFNLKKDEGILTCQLYCGDLCGRGLILKIKKKDKHWIIVNRKTTWVS
jgi:hypothetical protein